MSGRTWHLVAYDVRDDGRLRLTAHVLEGYGERVQYSLFRCRLTAVERRRLEWELARVLDAADSLLVIPICQHCAGNVQESSGRDWGEPARTYRVI